MANYHAIISEYLSSNIKDCVYFYHLTRLRELGQKYKMFLFIFGLNESSKVCHRYLLTFICVHNCFLLFGYCKVASTKASRFEAHLVFKHTQNANFYINRKEKYVELHSYFRKKIKKKVGSLSNKRKTFTKNDLD